LLYRKITIIEKLGSSLDRCDGHDAWVIFAASHFDPKVADFPLTPLR
jgi:hypothetical protein